MVCDFRSRDELEVMFLAIVIKSWVLSVELSVVVIDLVCVWFKNSFVKN